MVKSYLTIPSVLSSALSYKKLWFYFFSVNDIPNIFYYSHEILLKQEIHLWSLHCKVVHDKFLTVISKLNTRSQFRVFSPSDNCTSTLICTSTLFSLLFSYLSHHIGPSFFPSLSSPFSRGTVVFFSLAPVSCRTLPETFFYMHDLVTSLTKMLTSDGLCYFTAE